MTRRVLSLFALILATAMLVACGGGAPASDTIEATGTDSLAFEPDEFTAAAGEITVELTSQEGVEHTFVVEDLGDELVAEAPAGETDTGTVTIDEPGTYTVYCDVPGHREAGMEATLEVVES